MEGPVRIRARDDRGRARAGQTPDAPAELMGPRQVVANRPARRRRVRDRSTRRIAREGEPMHGWRGVPAAPRQRSERTAARPQPNGDLQPPGRRGGRRTAAAALGDPNPDRDQREQPEIPHIGLDTRARRSVPRGAALDHVDRRSCGGPAAGPLRHGTTATCARTVTEHANDTCAHRQPPGTAARPTAANRRHALAMI